MKKKVIFIYLYAFNATGGIEKYNRSFLKVLYELNETVDAISLYDSVTDERYLPGSNVRNCSGNRIRFIRNIFRQFGRSKIIFIGHIHLLPVAFLLKVITPSSSIIFNIHGVEVWKEFNFLQRALMRSFHFLSVSRFTATKFVELNNVPWKRVSILPNCVDPFFEVPDNFILPQYLQKRYKISSGNKVLLAVTRMTINDTKKNYMKVIEVLPSLKKRFPGIVFLLCGHCDALTYSKITALIKDLNVAENVIMPGYISNDELRDHYLLADVYVLPSEKEGFGISFLEALACGKRVVASNTDGSIEGLRDKAFGEFINSSEQLLNALVSSLTVDAGSHSNRCMISKACMQLYSYSRYRDNVFNFFQTMTSTNERRA